MTPSNDLHNAIAATLCGSFPIKTEHNDVCFDQYGIAGDIEPCSECGNGVCTCADAIPACDALLCAKPTTHTVNDNGSIYYLCCTHFPDIAGQSCNCEAATLTHSPFSSAFEQSERELGERIGWPAMVYQSGPYHTASATPGYVGVFEGGDELSAQEQAARLNRLEEEIQSLRLQLESAHQHVGALTKELDTAIAWIKERGQPSAMYAPTAKQIVPQLESALAPARAWRRRGAK